MKTSLHHAHLFASNIENSLQFYREMFGAEVIFDLEVAGARNVMISIGSSKINFYDQSPKDQERGVVHHLGIETDDLEGLIAHMESKGFKFIKQVKRLGPLKYVMAEGPDHVLFELFQVVKNALTEEQYNRLTSIK